MRKALVSLVVLAALTCTQIVAANAAVTTFTQLFGGSQGDFARGIFVDSNHIYIVGETGSFGPNPPNLFLSIFRLDNSHKCSVAVDLGYSERGMKVVAYGGNVYAIGDTKGDLLLVKFDTDCNVLRAAVYNIDRKSGLPSGLSISPEGSTLFITGIFDTIGFTRMGETVRAEPGYYLLAVRTSDLSVAWAKLFKMAGASSVTFSGNKLYVTGWTSTGDLFISKFDAATGNHELTKVFSTSQSEAGTDIVVTGGKVYVVGTYHDPNPNKLSEILFMRLDTNLNLELAKTFGTPSFEDGASLSMVGGLAYVVAWTNVFGTPDTALFAVNPMTGDISHAFVLRNDTAYHLTFDSTSTGTCLIYTGGSAEWPLFYAALDSVTSGTISFTTSSPPPLITIPSLTPSFPTPTATRFTPAFNTPSGGGDAFYSRFCPDALTVSTTITSTGSVLTKLTLTTTLTQYFAEPITTYLMLVLLAVVAALLAALLVVGRRRKLPSG
jgi:hypothetical protein